MNVSPLRKSVMNVGAPVVKHRLMSGTDEAAQVERATSLDETRGAQSRAEPHGLIDRHGNGSRPRIHLQGSRGPVVD